MVEYRDGARFKKQLSVNNTNWGSEIKDAVVSPLYSSVYDGNISFFPKFELTASNSLLKEGQVPLGNSYASTYYIVEFPTITTPTFGSADLDSINLHLHGKDLNYNNNVMKQQLEVYKFKRQLPERGIFLNPVRLFGESSSDLFGGFRPERPLIASGTYSGGPRIFESFDGYGKGAQASAMTPSLYTGTLPSNDSTDYYSTLDGYYEMNNAAGWGPEGGGWGGNEDDFGDRGDIYEESYNGSKVIRYLIKDGDQIVPSLSNAGGNPQSGFFGFIKEVARDDPQFSIWRWDWAQAVAHGKESEFVSQVLYRFSTDERLTIQANDIDVNVAAELPKYSLDTNNSFFDSVDYTKIRRDWSDVDPDTGRATITSVSTPHFSSEGSPSSGQCLRFWNKINLNDPSDTPSENVRNWAASDKIGYNSMRVVKQIPKPIPMARKSGATDQLDSMRVRMKIKIQDMSKMHRTGDVRSLNKDIMTGNNLTRSLVILLASRPPANETLGAYLHKLNSGASMNQYKKGDTYKYHFERGGCRQYNSDGDKFEYNSTYSSDDFTLCPDGWNTQVQFYDSGITSSRFVNKTNNYNGIAICKVPSGTDEDTVLTDVDKTYGATDDDTVDVNADDSTYNGLFPSGVSHVTPNSAESASEGRFIMFHTGRSYGRFNHFDGIYQGTTTRSDTNVADYQPFVIRPGVAGRRGDEYLVGANGALNPVVIDEFTVDNVEFFDADVAIRMPSWDGRIVPGMMVTGDNIAYREHLGATVAQTYNAGSPSNKSYMHISDYSGSKDKRTTISADTTAGVGSLTFKGSISPHGPNPETFKYLNYDEEGIDLTEEEWFFVDAYINHNDNPEAWLGTGGNLTGQDGQQSTITWVISDSEDRVLAEHTQCHSGAGGKTGATTTSAAGTSTTIAVSLLEKFTVGDCIAIDNDANSSSMERMIVQQVAGTTNLKHGKQGAGNIVVKRGYQGDTLVSVADAKHIYHVPTSQSNMAHGYPAYLSIWVNNCKIGLQDRLADATGHKWGEGAGTETSFYSLKEQASIVDVFIDYISIENFQPGIKNVTPTVYQGVRGNLSISGKGEDAIIDTTNVTIAEPLRSSEYLDSSDEREITPTYLTWGTNTNIWSGVGSSGKTQNIFMGGRTSTLSAFDPTDAAKRIKYTVGDTDEESDIRFFTFPSQSTEITNSSTASDYTTSRMGFGLVRAGSFIPNRSNNFNGSYYSGLNAHGVNIGLSSVYDATASLDDNKVDSFTKKGFFTTNSWLNFAADPTHADASATKVSGVFIKTLNPLMSTKITRIIDTTKGEIEVANSDALKGYEDDEYIIYRLGYSWNHGGHAHVSGHYYRRGLFIKDLKTVTNKVTLEVSTTRGMGRKGGTILISEYGTPLVHDYYLSDLYISPLKYWVNCEIYNRDEEDGDLLPDINYSHSLICDNTLTPDASTLGLTFDEYKYSDSVVDSSRWSLDALTENSLIEAKIDYGFGSLKSSTSQDIVTIDFESGVGYIRKQELTEGENILELKGLVDVEKTRLIDTTEKVSLILKASNETSGAGTILSTKYDETGYEPSRVAPRLTYIYRDALPIIENFTVKPYEKDPFYPEYIWETSDDDLWYGFIILDRESISHQYHKAALHIPLNEVPKDINPTDETFIIGSETYAYPYITGGDYTAGTRRSAYTASQHKGTMTENLTTSIEGLAGNCLIFDGTTITDDKQILSFDNPAPATKNMSIIAHFTVDSLSKITDQRDNKAYIISAAADDTGVKYCYGIWVDDGGIINASVLTDDETTEVILSSKYVVPFGTEEPVCVILTVDVELVVGNVKLFVNGKLEDQSGKKTTDGSSNNWKTGQEMESLTRNLYIGSQVLNTNGLTTKLRARNNFNGKIEEIVIYNHTIYPVIPTDGKMVLNKPIEELTDSSEAAAGRPIVAKLFIKDYHNIRGTTPEEVTQTSQISVRKAGLGLYTAS